MPNYLRFDQQGFRKRPWLHATYQPVVGPCKHVDHIVVKRIHVGQFLKMPEGCRIILAVIKDQSRPVISRVIVRVDLQYLGILLQY
jgi:hypothetical protein